jgi:hypothetical protein
MIRAIQTAVSLYQTKFVQSKNVRDDRKTLKLFMAPEFYFRGVAGAYTFDLMIGDNDGQGILDRLRVETSKHPDWLFVLGTFVVGSEQTGVACYNHVPGQWMDPKPATWDAGKRVLTCPQCHKQMKCGTCGTLLTVFKPFTRPPQYWNSDRDYFCPKCNKATKFRELINSIVIDNYAMVQKGGFTRGDGINDYCMQKELISNLDFEKMAGDPKKVKLFGDWLEPSEPPASGGTMERMGGGVFTMDGITFGMEICLDHLVQRLKKDLNRGNIQIQLIPSAGMEIKPGSVACVNGGLLFNVDGVRGDAVVMVNGGAFTPKPSKGTQNVPNLAPGYFPGAANQRIELFGPLDIPYA